MGTNKMKNLLIYVHPSKEFKNDWNENHVLSKIQIENSLALGWKPKDIMLVTNFDYEYNGVKSIVVPDSDFCDFSPCASKINAIVTLFERGLIGDELYWFHDFDAFQVETITEEEMDLKNDEIAMTGYGITHIDIMYNLRWSTGTIFFRKGSRDFFELLKSEVYRYRANEEVTLLDILKKRRFQPLKQRIKRIDITYNLATRRRDISAGYESAIKPIKVLHFHPLDKRKVEGESDNIDVCIYGKNRLNKVLASDKLIELFKKYELITK